MNKRPTLYLAALAAVVAVVVFPARSQATPAAASGEIAFSVPVHGVSQVFTVNPNGTGLRQITHRSSDAGLYTLSWSPGGRDLLFGITVHGRDRIVKAHPDGSGGAVIGAPCSGKCAGDDDGIYSPNGRRIAFDRAFGPVVNNNLAAQAIFTTHPDGSHLTELTPKLKWTGDFGPQWSPDGTKIAFVRNTGTGSDTKTAIYVMNADGSGVRRLTPFKIGAADPRWSPNGKQILFNTYANPTPGESSDLFVMQADGTHRTALTHLTGGAQQAFADDWSPDGKEVLFHRVTYSGVDTQVGHFYVLELAGRHSRRLAGPRITGDSRAAWAR
jgi:Tol biopolymer transport system component